MLIWDKPSGTGRTSGALYDPARNRWSPIARGPALNDNHSGPVWTGTQLVAWNGGAGTTGIAYTPAANSWSPCRPGRSPVVPAPARRWSGPAARW